jgi:hypothetical protein
VTAPQAEHIDRTWAFNPPPTWRTFPGFDPRLGHVPDPTWPPAPADWVWWVPNPARAYAYAPPPRSKYRKPLRVVLFGLVAMVMITGFVANLFNGWADRPTTGVGSCWAPDGKGLIAVSCKSDRATYTLVGDVKSPSSCPPETTEVTARNATYVCLTPYRP